MSYSFINIYLPTFIFINLPTCHFSNLQFSLIEHCERTIDETKGRVNNQLATIRQRREEKTRLENDARRLRAEADSACMRGSMNRELGLNHQRLLNEASQKMQEAQNKERVANDLDRLAIEGERNIHRLCDKVLVMGRQRADVKAEKEREEAKVADLGE